MRRIFLIISILVLCLALIFTFSACKETKKPVSEQKGEQTFGRIRATPQHRDGAHFRTEGTLPR